MFLNKLKKIFSFFLLISFLGCNSSKDPNLISIGAIASLSGAASEQGQNWVNGAKLAVEDFNNKGIKIELIIEDDQTEAKKAISSVNKLIQINKVKALIGGTWDYIGESIYPIAIKNKTLFITPTNPVEIISKTAIDSGFVYSNYMTLENIKISIKEFVKSKEARTIAVIYPNLPFGISQAEKVKEIIAEDNLELVIDYAFPVESLMSDTAKLSASKIFDKKPDLVYLVTDYNGLDLITKEFIKSKIKPLVLTTQHLEKAIEFSKDINQYQNFYSVVPSENLNNQFKEKYLKAYNSTPKVFSSNGYAAVEAIVEIFTNQTQSEKVFNTILGQGTYPNEKRLFGDGQSKIVSAQVK
jgi:branched-chain amino acid transport system substrate-binding protein